MSSTVHSITPKSRTFKRWGCTHRMYDHLMAISACCWGSHHKQPTGHLHSCWTLQSCCSNKHPKLRWASERVKNSSHFNALRRGRKHSGKQLGALQEGRLTGALGQVEVASGGEMDGPQQDPPWVPKHHPGAQHGKGHMHALGLTFTSREVNTLIVLLASCHCIWSLFFSSSLSSSQ